MSSILTATAPGHKTGYLTNMMVVSPTLATYHETIFMAIGSDARGGVLLSRWIGHGISTGRDGALSDAAMVVHILPRCFVGSVANHAAKGASLMSLEHNKALVQRFFGILNTKEHVNALHEVLSPQCLVTGQPTSLAQLQDFILMMRTAFPDEQLSIETLIAEGEYVAVRLSSHGTHQGPWWSPLGLIPPTGRAFLQTGMHFFRISGGLIVELWTEWNVLGQLQHLGVVSAPDLALVGD